MFINKEKEKRLKRLLLIALTLFCVPFVFSQSEASNWYFGDGAGIQFNQADGSVNAVFDGQLSTREGCASISDSNGTLQFYTDGITVYNRNHAVMQNGTGLFGDPSSTQSAIIVPRPQNPDIYYIFTVDVQLQGEPVHHGFNYSVVDMTLNGGLGEITIKNVNLLARTSEKISAVLKDCDDESIWVVTFANDDGISQRFDTYYAYEVSATGVNSTPVRSTFPISIGDQRGYLKLSPDGEKMAVGNMTASTIQEPANYPHSLLLYDFDVTTGLVTNQQSLLINTQSREAYGLEFSPNSQYLYVHSSANTLSSLTQFDLLAADIQASEFTLDDRGLYRGGLQLGPNGKIYRALSSSYFVGQPFLGVIHNPNEAGAASNYEHNAISVAPNTSSQGLPPFIQSFFDEQIDIINNGVSTINLDLCENETYTLTADDIPGAIYSWTMDGLPLAETDFDLFIDAPGHYEVFVDPNNGDCEYKEGQAFVAYFDLPVANPAVDVIICDDNNDSQSSFDLVTTSSEILGGQNPDVFSVRYYITQNDADNNTNEIVLPLINSSNPQQIFARIENSSFAGCFDTTSFTLTIYDTPIANIVDDIEVCDSTSDGDDMNGQTVTDLGALSSTVMGGQDASLFDITYHLSQTDADANINALPLNYYNTTPDLQEIFIRIENNTNTDCFDTTSFNIIVNRLPEAFDSLLFQCDEDGTPDGFTLFNLTEAFDILSGGNANRSAKYYTSYMDAQASSNEIDGNAYSNVFNPEIIYVQIIDDLTGCFSISELTLEVSATNANDAVLTACDDDGTEDGHFAFTLSDADSDVLAGLPPGIQLDYYESYQEALLENNPLGTTYTNTIPYSQVIYVRAENDNDCYGINEIQLTIYELPNLEIEEELIYCLNFYPDFITLYGGVIGDDPNNYSYDWSTGETTPEIQVNEPGIYTVTVTNNDGCSKNRTITVLPSNLATFDSINVVDGAEFGTITVNISGEGDYEFAIDDINGPYQDSNVFDNVAPGFHTIYVRDKNDCGIVEQTVSVIGFPKFFTPNNDSYHDTWQVYGVSNQFQPSSKIYIFDRYGKLLKQLSPGSIGWDGTFNGKLMPDNDYWFEVTLEDGRVYRNHFALKR